MTTTFPTDMTGEAVIEGQLVWAHGAVDQTGCHFPGNVMKARVLRGTHADIEARNGVVGRLNFIGFGDFSEDRCVWIEQVATPAAPIKGDPWVTRWPARALLSAG